MVKLGPVSHHIIQLRMLRQPITCDTMIFTFFSLTLGVTNGQIMFVDSNKVATLETRHTNSTIEWKKGIMDGVIGIGT